MNPKTLFDVVAENFFMFAYPAVYLVGIGVALKKWSRCPTAGLLCVSGLGVMLARSAMWIVPTLLRSDWLREALRLPRPISFVIGVSAMGLVIAAVFADRSRPRTTESEASDLAFDRVEF